MRLKKIIKKIIPHALIALIKNFIILNFEYGHLKSSWRWSCIDKYGQPIPWYTYPAIEYLKQLNFSDKIIFEYGLGNSTLFWAGISKRIISVDDNKEWFEKMSKEIPRSADILLITQEEEYIQSIHRFSIEFDVVIIDGKYRDRCCKEAVKRIKEGGLIILDNSDWYSKSAEILRNSDLIQVDMAGFGPINGYTWTTSFFFHRKFNFKPKFNRQPIHGLGSVKEIID